MYLQNSRTASAFRNGRSSMLIKAACVVAFVTATFSLGSLSAAVSKSEQASARSGQVTASRKTDRLPVNAAPAAEDTAAGDAIVRDVGMNTTVVERAPTRAERTASPYALVRQPSSVTAQ